MDAGAGDSSGRSRFVPVVGSVGSAEDVREVDAGGEFLLEARDATSALARCWPKRLTSAEAEAFAEFGNMTAVCRRREWTRHRHR